MEGDVLKLWRVVTYLRMTYKSTKDVMGGRESLSEITV